MIIELTKKTTSFQLFDAPTPNELREALKAESESAAALGFTDVEATGDKTRAVFSRLEPFDVEAFKDGFNETLTLERKKTCEFIADDTVLCAWGDGAAVKLLKLLLNLEAMTFEFDDLYRLQARMQLVKSIKLQNPKEQAVRSASLNGNLECYEEFNIIQPNDHEIKSVSGKFNAIGLGDITLNVTAKGLMKIGVKQICDVEFDTIKSIVGVIYGK